MQKETIPYKNSVINICFFGQGAKALFCFHGFGEDGTSFYVLESFLGKEYKIIAIDLPFHGHTIWKDELLFRVKDLEEIISIILNDKLNITPPRFSILGYSLGGRIALELFQKLPEKIERVVLLAPDGLKVNFWYWLGTQTTLGNNLFSFTMRKPYWFFKLTTAASKMGLLNKSIINFVHYYLDDENERSLLYKRWTTLRHFKPDLNRIKETITTYKTPVRFLFGSYDRIILSKRSAFFKKDSENIHIKIIPAGHQLLKEKFAAEIALLFSQ